MAVFFGWISSHWFFPVPGDKSDDADPENVPDEGVLQEKEEAEARPLGPLDSDGLRILYLGSPKNLMCHVTMCIPACKNKGQDNYGPGNLPVANGISLQ